MLSNRGTVSPQPWSTPPAHGPAGEPAARPDREKGLITDSWDQYCSFNLGKIHWGHAALDGCCVAPPCYQPIRRPAILVFYSDSVCGCSLSKGLLKGLRSTLDLESSPAVSHRFWSLACLHRSSSLSVYVWSHTSLCYLQLCLVSRPIKSQ